MVGFGQGIQRRGGRGGGQGSCSTHKVCLAGANASATLTDTGFSAQDCMPNTWEMILTVPTSIQPASRLMAQHATVTGKHISCTARNMC